MNVEANKMYFTEISYPSDIVKSKIIFSWSFWSNSKSDNPILIYNRYTLYHNAITIITHEWNVNQIVRFYIKSIYVNYSVA